MADYVSRQLSPSNKNDQVKVEEMWNIWLTVNKIKCEKLLLDEQCGRGTETQPITGELAEKSDQTDNREVAIERALSKHEKQTL